MSQERWRTAFPFKRGTIRIGYPDFAGSYRQEFQYEESANPAEENESFWNVGDFLRYLTTRGYSKKELLVLIPKFIRCLL